MAQLEDPILASALQEVTVVDGKPTKGVNQITYPHFSIKKKLLYQVVKKNDECMELLLVPCPFVQSVLQLAHSHLHGAHLGVENTLAGLRHDFTGQV